ncbi:nSTAND1 domain-containing NTPase [Synechococcus sp. BDU 130192]|uniref:nSTAND1 domain-containing NTPase n=1 Tax=Synechococcus sp. BDU 130192 TaxID=2042059 RepID=UPI000C06FEE8|nr:hypothetical protein [Synechococcus sp. BDU 130192]
MINRPGPPFPTSRPIVQRLADRLWSSPRSDAQPGLYLVRCNYQAQEQELLAQLQGNLKLRWHQVFSQFTAAYYSDQALADLEKKAIAQGLLCLWLEPQADDLGAILNLLETTLTNLGIQPSHINGAMVFGLTPAINLTAATFQSQIAPWIVTLPTANYQQRQVSDGLATATDLGEITWPSQALQNFWQRTEQDYFQKLAAAGPLTFLDHRHWNLAPGQRGYRELELATKTLSEGAGLLCFIQGRQAHQDQQWQTAQQAYQESLHHYCRGEQGIDWLKVLRDNPNSPLLEQLSRSQGQQLALILFHLGLLLGDRPQHYQAPSPEGEQALHYLHLSRCLWERQEQWVWVSQLSLLIGVFLQQWQRRSALGDLAWSLLKGIQEPWPPELLAQHYGLMAAIALQEQQWHKAQTLAQTALEHCQALDETPPVVVRAWSALISAQANQALGQFAQAIATLEEILPPSRSQLTTPKTSPIPWGHWQQRLYDQIFACLGDLYRQGKDYRQAFDLAWERQQYEQSWGWRPFVGTQPLPDQQRHNLYSPPEPLNLVMLRGSQRDRDLQALIARLQRPQPNLILLHGATAVGKTSLLRAGLIPRLQSQPLDGRPVQVIYFKNYGQWACRLVQQLHGDRPFCPWPNPPNLDPLVHLQQQQDFAPLTVLIFDQFEQFFLQYPNPEERQDFLRFLAQSLQLPTVKVILSCRNEALAPLLDWEAGADLGEANHNLFDHRLRHRLGNLRPDAAIALLERVATWAKLPLDKALIQQLIQDLQDGHGEIRPLELQVIGAQLHQDYLYTREEYLGLGFPPKLLLLERSLLGIIRYCGDENRDLAWQFLHYFTDLRHSQLVLTKADILQLGRQFLGDRRLGEEKAELILHIFKTTGLIRAQLYGGQESYQLARPDLVEPIRHHYQAFQSQQWLQRITGREREMLWRRWWKVSVGTVWRLGLVAIALGFGLRWVELQRYQRWQGAQNAILMKLTEAAKVLQDGAQPVEALRESIRAAVVLQRLDDKDDDVVTPATRLKVLLALEQNFSTLAASTTSATVRDFSQNFIPAVFRPPGDRQTMTPDVPITDFAFVGDSFQLLLAQPNQPLRQWPNQDQVLKSSNESITNLAWQPRGHFFVTGGDDRRVKLRQRNGQIVQTLGGFQDKMNVVAWSRDGKMFAAGSQDQTVRLWTETGELLQILTEHRGPITALQFSPDGKLLATAAGDRTVQIWQRRRNNSFFLVTQFPPFATEIMDLQFGADSRHLGLTGRDHQVFVYPMTYENNNPVFGEPSAINHQSNGPDRIGFYGALPLLITNTENHHLQFWQLDGTYLGSLTGHQAPITQLHWQPQRKAIATLDQNNQLILWNLDLDELLQKSCRLLIYGDLKISPSQRPGDRQLCTALLDLPPE